MGTPGIMIKQASVAFAVLAAAAMAGCSNQASEDSSDTTTTTTTTTGAAADQTLSAQINTVDGKRVADTTIDFTNGYATVTVETVENGILTPGFHAMHIHAVGTCDANGNFASAGEHFQAPGHTGQPASGDLPPLLVRADGAGKLVATSDAFTLEQLKTPQGSSIVLHESAPADGAHTEGDQPRIACGVLSPATATTSVSTSTSTVTTTAVAPVPPASGPETPTTTTTSETSPTTTTTTETTTETTESTSVTTTPPPPGG